MQRTLHKNNSPLVSQLRITRPDDWHIHLRDGDVLRAVLPHTVERFTRAIVMPNLKPPVATTAQALEYRQRILEAAGTGSRFTPLMTLYLTDQTPAQEVVRADQSGHVYAVKLYPAGATTHSESGVTNLRHIHPVIETLERLGMPLLVHGETTDPDVDVFDRERVFIERELIPLLRDFPGLRVVLEHVTTSDAVQFVEAASDNVAATITAHHLLLNRNAMFAGGIRPHHYCLPVLKRERHRGALLQAATSGSPKFFLGTDSAPHPRAAKETGRGCAGIYTAHAAVELYAQAFEQAGALERLEGFASIHGPSFYGLPRNTDSMTLVRRPWRVPDSYPLGSEEVVPLAAGEELAWSLAV